MDALGPYRICRRLGAGSFGVVYHAEHQDLTKPVAIKLLSATPDEKSVVRFQREAQLLASLRHRNIVYVDAWGVSPSGQPYIVMEFVDGVTLKDSITARGTIPVEETLTLLVQICSAIEYMHDNGIVHRDIKPGNIILDKHGVPKLADFGTARLFEDDSQKLTKTGSVVGTPMYMSPEAVVGKPDERSDLYALGCVMFECLTGHPPYQGDSIYAIMDAHAKAPIPECPGAASMLIQKALAKTQDKRYQSAKHMKSDIERVLKGQVITFEPFEAGTAPEKIASKGRKFVSILAMTAAAIFVLAGLTYRQPKPAPHSTSTVLRTPETDEQLDKTLQELDNHLAKGHQVTKEMLATSKQAVVDARARSPKVLINALCLLCSMQKGAGDPQSALLTCTEAINIATSARSPSVLDAYMQKGTIYMEMKDYPHAEECYRKLIDFEALNSISNELHALAYRNIACIQRMQTKYEQSVKSSALALEKLRGAGKSPTHQLVVLDRAERAYTLALMGKKAERDRLLDKLEADILSQNPEITDPDCFEVAIAVYVNDVRQNREPDRARRFLKRADPMLHGMKRGAMPLYAEILADTRKSLGMH